MLTGAFLGMAGEMFHKAQHNQESLQATEIKPVDALKSFKNHFYFYATQLGLVTQPKSLLFEKGFNLELAKENWSTAND